ncbi:efflux RND transporter periplasmic adaptor subunit [Dyella jejuensis]|uniref:Efflux RND transporter periplasmic adaptor subunit n=1 Tax=Dyella jejuensis TaxID=1432009 RepID=A0ABW8JHE7_9GAMM
MTRLAFKLLMAGLVTLLAACRSDDTPEAAPTASVRAKLIRQGDLPHIVSAYGSAVAANDASVTLSVQAMGRVGRWLVAPGAAVHQRQALLRFDLAPSALSAYQQALSAVRAATSARAHLAALLSQQLATRDQLDQADKSLGDAETTLAALRKEQGDSASLTLYAPCDGVVQSIDATHGEVLAPGVALLTLIKKDGLVAQLGLERSDQNVVHDGDSVTLQSIEGAQSWQGTVLSVGQVLDPHTHQLDVIVSAQGTLLAGEALRGDIVAGSWHGWLVPRDAVLGDDQHVLFQLDGLRAVRVPVTLVGESDHTSVVSGAIDGSRPLVVVGADQLDDGMAVRVDKNVTP